MGHVEVTGVVDQTVVTVVEVAGCRSPAEFDNEPSLDLEQLFGSPNSVTASPRPIYPVTRIYPVAHADVHAAEPVPTDLAVLDVLTPEVQPVTDEDSPM